MIFISSLVLAQSIKIEFPLGDEFEAGENITLKITVLDSENKPIDGEAFITIENLEKTKKISKNVQSKELVSLNLGEGAPQGYWDITAEYPGTEKAKSRFIIKVDERLSFEIEGDILTITNTGNIKYSKPVQVKISDSIGEERQLNLNIGEKTNFRLIASEGNYNIQVISDGKVLFSKTQVHLTGKGFTGEIIGALDESISQRAGITGGISPEGDSDEALLSYFKNSKFVYVFVMVIFGAMILLAIERSYRKKADN